MVPYSGLIKIAHNPTSKRYIFFTSFIVWESYEFMAYQNHLADLLNYKSLGPPPRVSDSCRSVWGLIICISNKSSGDANTAGPEITLWEPLFRPMLLKAFVCFNMHTSFPNTLLNADWFWFSRSSTGLCDSALLTSSQIILFLLVHISYFGYQGNRMKSVDFEFRENWAFVGGGFFCHMVCVRP